MSAVKGYGPGAVPFGIVGESPAIVEVVDFIQKFGPTAYTVLITGESGTGKELVATAIHAVSGRDPLIPVNCSAIPRELAASELFGYVKGAFTGADGGRRGHFAAAAEGIIFLDEIGELPYAEQSMLLRVLEDGEILPVGTSRPKRLDVRVIAATNQDLTELVKQGRFREDLLWRLNRAWIHLAPLRERLSDLPLLAEHFAQGTSITKGAMSRLQRDAWPGNVRQLQNVIDVARVHAGDGAIRTTHADAAIEMAAFASEGKDSAEHGPPAETPFWMRPRHELLREQTLSVFEATGRNPCETASVLHVALSTVYRNLEEYGALPRQGATRRSRCVRGGARRRATPRKRPWGERPSMTATPQNRAGTSPVRPPHDCPSRHPSELAAIFLFCFAN